MRTELCIRDDILEIICNSCVHCSVNTVLDVGKMCQECNKYGVAKVLEELLDEFKDTIREGIEYDLWEQSKGEDL